MCNLLTCSFGSQRIGSRTGILFNDEMNDFIHDHQPWPRISKYLPRQADDASKSPKSVSYANEVEPGKRPMSSMCPTIIVDGNGSVTLVIGASGGIRITSATAFVIIFHYMNLLINDHYYF